MSAGVFSTCRITSVRMQHASVINPAVMAIRIVPLYIPLRILCMLPEPKSRASGMHTPVALPFVNPRTRNWTDAVAPTAPRAKEPRKRATIAVSARL